MAGSIETGNQPLIERLVSFGIRRPGYEGDLAAENYLATRFREIGLNDVRMEPVPVHRWEPESTSVTRIWRLWSVCSPNSPDLLRSR